MQFHGHVTLSPENNHLLGAVSFLALDTSDTAARMPLHKIQTLIINHESSAVLGPTLVQHPHGRPKQHEASPVCW